MKKVLFLLMSTGFITATALSKNFDRYPAIQINGKFYTIDCLCLDGNTLRHRDPAKDIARSIIKEERFCNQWDSKPEKGGNCLEWVMIEKDCPLTYTVKKLHVDEETEHLVGIESYTIPKCDGQ